MNWGVAMVFYLLYIGGILFFAVNPVLASGTVGRAATLDRWPVKVVVVDIDWGSALCALVATGAFLIGKRLS